ncbi:MAG: transcriptional repressor [Planctomycetaceae bacterium]|jgi:Fur family transcriptional regulator, ferric uptake regulator|nr:transcriptional repressor [Planctomycetaceae bacterium]
MIPHLTHPKMNSSPSQSSHVERLKARIRDASLRCTAARLAVLLVLSNAKSPLTHAEVADLLIDRGIDKATVFRNLVDLVDAEILSRTELGDHVWRFEVRLEGSAENEQHPHFVCLDCGAVTCLSDLDFDAPSRRATSRVGDIKEILIKGVCVECRPAS